MQYSTCQSFGTDCKDLIAILKEPHDWPNFATKLERIEILHICFPDFKITHILWAQNQISDSLTRTARSFHRELHFVGCFILVWLPRPPQVWVIEWPFVIRKKLVRLLSNIRNLSLISIRYISFFFLYQNSYFLINGNLKYEKLEDYLFNFFLVKWVLNFL